MLEMVEVADDISSSDLIFVGQTIQHTHCRRHDEQDGWMFALDDEKLGCDEHVLNEEL
jgi:hypothetical protein